MPAYTVVSATGCNLPVGIGYHRVFLFIHDAQRKTTQAHRLGRFCKQPTGTPHERRK
eukprot:TRINITY_DN321_c0_g1_i1.p1 TRINITY_DN321_c0_g1~~TRINITY_DN321_c0_g1_i1.p1  ORF type:complete len:57 (-),score=0.52 TRINITY_DN321_c0_g1_i1:61-231(-)